MKSQTATATLGNIVSCAGEDVLVPLDVNYFYEVGAMTIYIGYDTNAAEFLSLENINPSIPAPITFFSANSQIGIIYTSPTPFYISGEKLFDLSFHFLGDSTFLPFNPGTEIATTDLVIIPLETYPGSIVTPLRLIDQPDSVMTYPDNDVIFRVTSLGNPDYQWQENTGPGWMNLQNNDIYSGVANDTLTIHDVPLGFNGYTYRCTLTADNCTVISDVALLTVAEAFPAAALGFVSSCPESEVLVPLTVEDFLDVIDFTFNISFNTGYLTFQGLENIHPDLIPGNLSTAPLTNPPGIAVHWDYSSPVTVTGGKLFDLKFDYDSQDHALDFEAGSIVLNSLSNPVDITLNNGEVNQHPVPLITGQPQDASVMEGEDATFTVVASGTDDYLWQISTDGGSSWEDLTETIPYYNITTPVLTISPVSYSMDEYQFACRLENEYCTGYSSAATLLVDTLVSVGAPDGDGYVQVCPVPFRDRLRVSLPGDYACSLISVYDMRGMLLETFKVNQTRAPRELDLDLSSLSEGVFFLKVEGTRAGRIVMEQKKILKTN